MNLLLDLNGVIELSGRTNEELLDLVRGIGKDRAAVLTSMSGFGIAHALSEEQRALFARLFSTQSYSLTKRDPLLFEKVLEELGWEAEETVFVDDLPQNVQAAERAGLTTVRFSGNDVLPRISSLIS